jgi:predicted Na+-dependent transporter
MQSSQKAAQTAININYRLERLIPFTTPSGILIGFLLPFVFLRFRPYVPLLFGVITFAGALKLRARELGATVKKPACVLLFFFTSHVLMPLLALLSSSVFFAGTDVITGFVLLFAGPTAVSGFFWVMIFRGNKAFGLSFILLDTMLAPFLVPLTLSVLLKETISMDMSGIAFSLFLMVVLPTIIGVAVNETSGGKIPAVICPYLDPVSKIVLVFVIAINASPLAQTVRLNDPLVWKTAGVCILLTVTGFILAKTAAVVFRFDKDRSISMIIAGGLRNNSAVMTIAVAFFPQTAALPILLSIALQQSVMALMGKLLIKTTNTAARV